jgi:hypothetical protein
MRHYCQQQMALGMTGGAGQDFASWKVFGKTISEGAEEDYWLSGDGDSCVLRTYLYLNLIKLFEKSRTLVANFKV